MSTFKRFQDIHAWQKSESGDTPGLSDHGRRTFWQRFWLSNQIQRASVSIMANIAEGFGRHSDREFANFLNMAHGSASETQSH